MGVSACASGWHPYVLVMAPALTETGQNQSFTLPAPVIDLIDAGVKSIPKKITRDIRTKVYNLALDEALKTSNGIKRLSIPLRAIDGGPVGASSMSFGAPMGDQLDTMGLIKSASIGQGNLPIMKANDVDQILAGMPAPNVEELMQVISTMDPEPDTPDFSLSSQELANFEKDIVEAMSVFPDEAVESESPDHRLVESQKREEEAVRRHFTLERQHSRLLRRMKKLEAREVGKGASDEVRNVLNRFCELASSDPSSRDTIATFLGRVQDVGYSSSNNRQRPGIRYFGSGSLEPPYDALSGCVVPKLGPSDREALKSVSNQLKSQVTFAEKGFDSDATESSSGGDSCDESVSYNNQLRGNLSM